MRMLLAAAACAAMIQTGGAAAQEAGDAASRPQDGRILAGFAAKFSDEAPERTALVVFVEHDGEREEHWVRDCASIDVDDFLEEGIAPVFECDERRYVLEMDEDGLGVRADFEAEPVLRIDLPEDALLVNGVPVGPSEP